MMSAEIKTFVPNRQCCELVWHHACDRLNQNRSIGIPAAAGAQIGAQCTLARSKEESSVICRPTPTPTPPLFTSLLIAFRLGPAKSCHVSMQQAEAGVVKFSGEW